MGYGGYHPYPRRFGGSGGTLLEAIHKSLNEQKGTAFEAKDPTTVVWLENMAFARALCFDGWGVNQRLRYLCDPLRMTESLRRWESILAIVSPKERPLSDRRRNVLLRFQRFGQAATHAHYTTFLRAELGDFFVAVEYTGPAAERIFVPFQDPSIYPDPWPFGTQLGELWSSTAARILVRLQKPAGATEGDFYERAGRVFKVLDPIAPAWVTFDWYRAPATGTPVNVTDGPSAAGFYFDDEHNLDNNVFDV